MPADTAWGKHIKIQSPMLTKFWGHAIYLGGIAFQAEGGFKALLDTLDQALTFSLAPTMVRFGVEPAPPQLGADQVAVGGDEGLALVGVELARQPAAQNGFLESVMKSLGVGLGVISGKGDE